MTCAACGHVMSPKTGELDLRINGELFIVRNVAFEECPNCGERAIAPDVSEKVYQDIAAGHYRREHIDIPVIEAVGSGQ